MKAIITILQLFSLLYEIIAGPALDWLSRHLGVMRLTALPPRFDFGRNKRNILKLAELLKTSKDIKMAFGELDSTIVQNKIFLDAIRYAVSNNGASIELIYGPSVDPKTTTIFQFAKEGLVKLHHTNEYFRHHFILINDVFGKSTIIDETIHNPTVWNQDGEALHKSMLRISYARRNSKHLQIWMEREYTRRKRLSSEIQSPTNPQLGSYPSQSPSQFRLLLNGVMNSSSVYITQPLAILLDKPLTGIYKDISYNEVVPSQHSLMEREANSVKPDQNRERTATEILNAESADNWISKLSSVLGEPTYTVDTFYDPEALDEIAVFHIRREDTNPSTELNDATAITMTILRESHGACSFRIDLRTEDEGKENSFYNGNIRGIKIDRIEERIDFFTGIDVDHVTRKFPTVSVYKIGKTNPVIKLLRAQN